MEQDGPRMAGRLQRIPPPFYNEPFYKMKFYRITGFDQFGREMIEIVPAPPPSLYFWLGRAAYPEPKQMISRLVVQRDNQRSE